METRVRTLVVEDDRATRMLLEDWVRGPGPNWSCVPGLLPTGRKGCA